MQTQFTLDPFVDLAATVHEYRGGGKKGTKSQLTTVHEKRLCYKDVASKCGTAPR